jgi:hypothetical protein
MINLQRQIKRDTPKTFSGNAAENFPGGESSMGGR